VQPLSSSMKNLSLNQQPQGAPGQFLPQSRSDQNFLNNNNGISNPAMPPLPTPKTNTMAKRPMYPQQPQTQQQPQNFNAFPGSQVGMGQQSMNQPSMNQPSMNQQPMVNHQQPMMNQQQPMMNPQQPQQPRGNLQYQNFSQPQQQFPSGGVVSQGFNRMWGNETVDLMQNRHILPTTKVLPPPIKLNHQFHEATNCSGDIFRCTLTKIPESNSLLQKSRLPLGILIHPYRDLSVSWRVVLRVFSSSADVFVLQNLPVISCTTIVRCRVCRTYINPFVFFVDSKKWKCNLCYRVNERELK
jgi:protein transport protein SEC24